MQNTENCEETFRNLHNICIHYRHGRRSVQYMPMEAPMMMMQPVLVPNPRRLSAVASGHANLAVSGLALPPNVIRLPRGPSKGKGFQNWCKTRMQPAAAPSAPAAELVALRVLLRLSFGIDVPIALHAHSDCQYAVRAFNGEV